MEMTTLDACFKKYVSPENFHLLLNEITDEEHIAAIAEKITDWTSLRPYFKVSYATEQAIENSNPNNYGKQKAAFVRRVVEPMITYQSFCAILHKRKRLDLVDQVCKIMQSSVPPRQLTPPSNPGMVATGLPTVAGSTSPPSHMVDKFKPGFQSGAMRGAHIVEGCSFEHDLPSVYWRLEDAYDGEGCTIAILDSGINRHRAFMGNRIVYVKNCLTAVDSPVIDHTGHGTHCAGVAAGNVDCIGIGAHDHTKCTRGVAPKANLIIYKVDDNGEAIVRALDDLIEKVRKGTFTVNVLSMSIGGLDADLTPASKQYYVPITEKINTLTEELSVICVAAAGNHGDTRQYPVCFPAQIPNIICIGAHDGNGKPCGFTSSGNAIDFLGPGYNVKGPSGATQDRYVTLSGTSPATAAIAGLICIFIQQAKIISKEAFDFVRHTHGMYELLKKCCTVIERNEKTTEAGYGSLDPKPLLEQADDQFLQTLHACGLMET